MLRRRSLLIPAKEEWTYEAEWNTKSEKRLQIIFISPLNTYDSDDNVVIDVQDTGNYQIAPRQGTSLPYKAMWEANINIIEPAETNGWKMTLNLYNALRTQIYVIKSATDGYASVMYDDGIKDGDAHNLENGVFVKDIPINTFVNLKIMAIKVSPSPNTSYRYEVYVNDEKVFQTQNNSIHYASTTRCMFQYQGKALLKSLKYAYLED